MLSRDFKDQHYFRPKFTDMHPTLSFLQKIRTNIPEEVGDADEELKYCS